MLQPLTEIGKTRVTGALSTAAGTQTNFQATRIGDGRIIARSGDNADTAWVCVKGLPGDVTADSLVMANDASQTLRAAVGLALAPLPPGHLSLTLYERFAADYNQNKIINVDDAQLILDKSLEGLVRKSSVASGAGPALISLGPAVYADHYRLVPLRIRLRHDIGAVRLVLRYDASAAAPDLLPAAEGTLWLRNDFALGHVRVGMINPESLVGNDDLLLQLRFRDDGSASLPIVAIESAELFDVEAQLLAVIVDEAVQTDLALPAEFILEQNYPNPFNPSTTIRCLLPREAHIHLAIFNSGGQLVRQLLDETRPAGIIIAEWNGRADNHSSLSSGIYFCRLQVEQENIARTIKVILLE